MIEYFFFNESWTNAIKISLQLQIRFIRMEDWVNGMCTMRLFYFNIQNGLGANTMILKFLET